MNASHTQDVIAAARADFHAPPPKREEYTERLLSGLRTVVTKELPRDLSVRDIPGLIDAAACDMLAHPDNAARIADIIATGEPGVYRHLNAAYADWVSSLVFDDGQASTEADVRADAASQAINRYSNAIQHICAHIGDPLT